MSKDTTPSQHAFRVLQAMQQPVVVVAKTNRIVWANYAAETFFGVSSSVLSRQKLTDFIAFDSPILALIDDVRRRQAPMTEYRVKIVAPRFSHERVTDVYANPIFDSEDMVSLLFQERTMADKIDRQLISRGAARSVTGLASMLAHEIKNPLAGIRGAAQLLEQTVADDEKQLARLVRDEADRIVKLVDRVEIFGDDRPLDMEPVNIHVILDKVKLLAVNGVAAGVKVVELYDPSLPPVLGNSDLLIQVFLNLMKNAGEALEKTKNPEIKISTAFRPGIRIGVSGSADRVSLPLEIVFEDNGPGVPPDILPYLFDPFVTTKLNGSGLGLALVAKIIGDHGGVIECASEPGHTRFQILLPVAKSGSEQDQQNHIEEVS